MIDSYGLSNAAAICFWRLLSSSKSARVFVWPRFGMSKLLKKTWKRVSMLGSVENGPVYPLSAPEVPNDLGQNSNGPRRTNISAVAPGGFESERPEEEEQSKEPITIAVIGAGQRGQTFGYYARTHPKKCKVVAVAEPRLETRTEFAIKHQIPDKHAFTSHSELLAVSDVLVADGKPRIAQAVIICVQDKMHAELSIQFARRGFHVLCEKPLGVNINECLQVTEEVEKANVVFALGHNFPYSPYAASLTELIHSGALGRLLHIVHIEPVGYYHFAHSYVRGNWQSEHTSAPIVLTKSSHDLDIFCRWFYPLVPKHVSSFGGLSHFRRERKPSAARGVMRCLECPSSVEQRCEYSAKRIYLSPIQGGSVGWPGNTIVDGRPTVEKMTRALEETPYGLCVYESDNDVPDHQTISIQFTAPTDDNDLVQKDRSRSNFRRLYAESPERSASQSRERSHARQPHRQSSTSLQHPPHNRAATPHYRSQSHSQVRRTNLESEPPRPRRTEDLPPTNPTISFTIAAHTDSICMRKTTLYFEHGEVIGDMSTYTVTDFRDFGRHARRVIPPPGLGGGHGGGDWALMEAWLRAIELRESGTPEGPGPEGPSPLGVGASVRDQLRVFMTGFAIEEARKELKVVDCAEFESRMTRRYARDRKSVV